MHEVAVFFLVLSTGFVDGVVLAVVSCTVHRSISPANSHRFRPPFVTIEVALDSSRKALSSHTNFGGCRWLEQKHEVAVFVRVFRCSGCEGEWRYRTLISLLGLLATMRRVVNYHSSWARQQQVELFDASGIRV
ncbi:galacturonokinase [Dorcoceras hygrometricum]|uniref:Galacturonokinase n=1 Tax=Dorcoceras hygrometricum TaxID=472368 RepID=A0A2Z7BDH5_9LAMI|nr:galacturonokinase [Dorcoceras hygrometricum]